MEGVSEVNTGEGDDLVTSAVDRTKESVSRREYGPGSHLLSLNVARNGLGPPAATALFHATGALNCTLTSLDVSFNPLGVGLGG